MITRTVKREDAFELTEQELVELGVSCDEKD
jgi:hypothetical protein